MQELFGLRLSRDEVEAIASGPAFARHSKFSDRDYGVEQRQLEHEAATEAHSEEIAMVVKWIGAVAAKVGVPLSPRR